MDQLLEATAGDQQVEVRDILEAFGGRAFGPLLLVAALLVVSPIGAIPFVPTVFGVAVVLIAVQRLFGREYPWLPAVVLDRSVARDRLVRGFEVARPWGRRFDRLTRPRLQGLATGPMEFVIAAVVVAIGGVTPPLELVPFAVLLPGVAVFGLGLAITSRDGAAALVGLGFAAGAIGLPLYLLV